MRDRISDAALFVKVTAKIPWGLASPVAICQAILCTNTLVLPLPAPAKISKLPGGAPTASRWPSLSDSST